MLLCTFAANRANQVKIAQEGGTVVILEAMRTHRAHSGIQKNGCAALSSLAMDDDNLVTIAEEGGIAVIVEAMRQHKANSGVLEYGCQALCNFAAIDDNRVKIAQEKGIAVILQVRGWHAACAVWEAPSEQHDLPRRRSVNSPETARERERWWKTVGEC